MLAAGVVVVVLAGSAAVADALLTASGDDIVGVGPLLTEARGWCLAYNRIEKSIIGKQKYNNNEAHNYDWFKCWFLQDTQAQFVTHSLTQQVDHTGKLKIERWYCNEF